jgi:hypothetical protein
LKENIEEEDKIYFNCKFKKKKSNSTQSKSFNALHLQINKTSKRKEEIIHNYFLNKYLGFK